MFTSLPTRLNLLILIHYALKLLTVSDLYRVAEMTMILRRVARTMSNLIRPLCENARP